MPLILGQPQQLPLKWTEITKILFFVALAIFVILLPLTVFTGSVIF